MHRAEVWTLDQIRTFLEKFFVYRRDFERISEFFPHKTAKDMVSFYYGIKKHLNLSQKEKDLKDDSIGDKKHYINKVVEEMYEKWFKPLETAKLDFSMPVTPDLGYHQSFTEKEIYD